jgi:hypothetical protein
MESALRYEWQDPVLQLSTLLNSSDVQLVPYVQAIQGWTLPDNVLLEFALLADRDGVFRTTFHDGFVKSPRDFADAMKNPLLHPIFAFRDSEPLGFGWINGIRENYCFAHFCGLKASWGDIAKEGAKMILRYWMVIGTFEFILGMIPGSNVRAMRFVESIGFRRVGEIPKMLVNKGDREASVFFYYSRFDHA